MLTSYTYVDKYEYNINYNTLMFLNPSICIYIKYVTLLNVNNIILFYFWKKKCNSSYLKPLHLLINVYCSVKYLLLNMKNLCVFFLYNG